MYKKGSHKTKTEKIRARGTPAAKPVVKEQVVKTNKRDYAIKKKKKKLQILRHVSRILPLFAVYHGIKRVSLIFKRLGCHGF